MTSQSPWGPECLRCPVDYLTPPGAMDQARMLVRYPAPYEAGSRILLCSQPLKGLQRVGLGRGAQGLGQT